jgi:hypothetical protein
MDAQEKVTALGHAVGTLLTLVGALVWSEVRAPLFAFCVGLAGQLALWLSAPITRVRKPPMGLVVLEAVITVVSLVASVFVSAWFAVPAVTTLVTTVGLVWARHRGPTPSRDPATRARAKARADRPSTVEDFRALHPWSTRASRFLEVFFLLLAALFFPMVVQDPGAVVAVACFAAFAGAVRFAEWLSAKSMTPTVRHELERRRARLRSSSR